MKILLWPANFFPSIGGLERLAHHLAIELKRQGHDVLVVTDNPNQLVIQFDELQGINVIRIPISSALAQGKLPLIKTILDTLKQKIELYQPDLINAHGWYDGTSFFQSRIIEHTRLPLFLTVHGLNPMHHQTTMSQRIWKRSCSINTVSKGLQQGLAQAGLTHQNLRVIVNGTPIPDTPILPKLQMPPSSTTQQLLCLGRLAPEKAFDNAIRAMKYLKVSHPRLSLTIAGDGDEFPALKALIKDLGLQNTVQLLGIVHPEDSNRLIDQADIVLVPSTSESFGLVALEAAMRSRPVIASDIAGLNEVVVNGLTGLLIAPNDPQVLANAIRTSLNNYTRLVEMGQAAHNRARKEFNIETMTERYLQMYKAYT